MKILLLGAAGFIGTNLTIELAKKTEDEITLVDRSKAFFKPIVSMDLKNVHILEADLTVDMDFDSILKDQEVVYHLVSTTVPTTSNQHISQELVSNVIFSANLFEACIRCDVKKVVFVSSGGTVYGKEVDCPLKEKTATNPISSYGVQKITIEKLLYLYRYMYGLDYRMHVFHIDNHGVSFARNFALDRAKGSYVYFVDSDDYLEEDTLEKMLSTMKENNCDCVMCASNHVNEVDMEDKQPKEETMDDIKLTQKQAVEALCYLEQPFDGYEMAAIWGTLYKKECIGEIRFNTKMKIGEDFEFKYKVFLNVESVICMKEKFYNYLIREKSAMRNGFDTTKIESATELQKLLKSEFALPEYKKALQSRVCNIVIVVLFMIPVEKKYEPYRKPIKVFLSENRKEVIKNPKSRNKVRGALLLSYIGFDFVQKLFFSARG